VSDALVTVALPVYNGEQHLEAALGAIRNQTYANLDILISDNASTDRTREIAEAAAGADSRIRYTRHPTNIGAMANFHYGLSQKRGEYFMWAAHDDEKLPRYIEATVAALERHRTAAMACTWTVIVSRNGERVHQPYSPAIASDRLGERLAAFIADPQCVAFYGLYRSSALDAAGPPDYWLDSDRHYLFRVLLRGPFEVVPEPLFRFRMFNSLDDYEAMGLKMRPGATDFDLDIYRYFPRLIREAGVSADEARRAIDAMRVPMRPYLDNRAKWLISRTLLEEKSRSEKVRTLFAFARQYPPMLRSRMFWGAVRRVLT
jgi:glycosyltransferase involved in cell wall biosynthesis